MSSAEAPANAAQIDYWNATAGEVWASFQEQLDRQLEPLGRETIRVLAPGRGEHVLDIGCGAGRTTLDLASEIGPEGHVVGIDISRPMLEIARRRPLSTAGGRVEFRECDAQTGDVGVGFDAAFSRFGVMFFSDPSAAFANIRHALKPAGRLTFVCWRPLTENPWMLGPIQASLPFLPPMPPPDPLAPGPFAFADPERVRAILAAAGFGAVTIEPFDTRVGGGDLEQSVTLALRIGPLGAALRDNPEIADKAVDAVRQALAGYVTPQGVQAPAATWIVSARNG